MHVRLLAGRLASLNYWLWTKLTKGRIPTHAFPFVCPTAGITFTANGKLERISVCVSQQVSSLFKLQGTTARAKTQICSISTRSRHAPSLNASGATAGGLHGSPISVPCSTYYVGVLHSIRVSYVMPALVIRVDSSHI